MSNMGTSTAIPLPEAQIAEICRRHSVQELAVFGSVLTDDFGPESDVDMLVAFKPVVPAGLFRLMELRDALSEAIGRPVDLGTHASLKWVIRDRVLASRRAVYVEG